MRAFDPGGSVVAITAAGRRALGQSGAQARVSATHGFGLRHARAVSWAAALLTIRGRKWPGARELRSDPSWRLIAVPSVERAHRPNLGVLIRHSPVAIEVELWRRPPRKVRSMLSGYNDAIASRQIDGLITVSDRADVLEAMSRAAGQVGPPDRCFAMRRLAEVQVTSHLLREQVSCEIAAGMNWRWIPRAAGARNDVDSFAVKVMQIHHNRKTFASRNRRSHVDTDGTTVRRGSRAL